MRRSPDASASSTTASSRPSHPSLAVDPRAGGTGHSMAASPVHPRRAARSTSSVPSPPSATGTSRAIAAASRTPRAIAAAAACALSVPLNALGAQTATACTRTGWCSHRVHGGNPSQACGDQNARVTSRAVTAGLGVGYVAASGLAPLILKTTPSDLDLYFWPSAETAVGGTPAAHLFRASPCPVSQCQRSARTRPARPDRAARQCAWLGRESHRSRGAGGAVTSLFVLLLAYQAVRASLPAARGGAATSDRHRVRVLLAPALGSGCSTTATSNSLSSSAVCCWRSPAS